MFLTKREVKWLDNGGFFFRFFKDQDVVKVHRNAKRDHLNKLGQQRLYYIAERVHLMRIKNDLFISRTGKEG